MDPALEGLIQKAAAIMPDKIRKAQVDKVRDIIQSEFPVDQPITDTGMTTLTVACSVLLGDGKDLQLLEVIMPKGPNINHADKFGRTPLHMACVSGNEFAV